MTTNRRLSAQTPVCQTEEERKRLERMMMSNTDRKQMERGENNGGMEEI